MTRVNEEIVRATAFRLHQEGWGAEANAVLDLLQAYHALDVELTVYASQSLAVAEVEKIVAAARTAGRISDDVAERCDSHYLSEANEELVQCQRFAGHAGPHTHDLLGSTTGEYAWGDADAFRFGQLEPVIAPRTSPELTSAFCRARYAGHPEHGNLICGEITGHTGDHQDVFTSARWSNIDDEVARARKDAGTRKRKAKAIDEYERDASGKIIRDASGNIIFPGQTSVEEQLLTLTRDESDNCAGCHKARQEFGDGFVCVNHDA